MSLALVVLAAGMGSRYGGLKQIDPVGPSGETVLDYAVFDALRAGFDRVVFVIRRDFEPVFRTQIGARYADQIAVEYVFQSVDALPEGFRAPSGREKPWGTGHAVWCARTAATDRFAVINADDFYGNDSFRRLAEFLRHPGSAPNAFAMVGFRLAKTLSENGAVSRGVCDVDENGALRAIVERTRITPAEVGPGKAYSGDEIVSMNCWGFTPELFTGLDRQFRQFLESLGLREGPADGTPTADPQKSEFYLPAAVSTMVDRQEASVTVLPTSCSWFGVTYREDKPRVTAAISALIASGAYPARLF